MINYYAVLSPLLQCYLIFALDLVLSNIMHYVVLEAGVLQKASTGAHSHWDSELNFTNQNITCYTTIK
jgi:hypothetical protein